MRVELKNIKIEKISKYLRKILEDCNKRYLINCKEIKDYDKNFDKKINDQNIHSITGSLNHWFKGFIKSYQPLINYLLKKEGIVLNKYYSKERLRELIAVSLAYFVVEAKCFNFEIDKVTSKLISLIENIPLKKYAFQIINLRKMISNFKIEDYEIVTLKDLIEEGIKVPSFMKDIHRFPENHPYCFVVSLSGNDKLVDFDKAKRIALNLINLLRQSNQYASNIQLNSAYLSHGTDCWFSCNFLDKVEFGIEWDQKGQKNFEDYISDFKILFKDPNNYCETERILSNAVLRIGSTKRIPDSYYSISEIIGVLESLFLTKIDFQEKGGQIDELLSKRIHLCGEIDNHIGLKKILKEFYDKRSIYSHTSENIKENQHLLDLISYSALISFAKLAKKYPTKKLIIASLEKK